MRAGWAVGLVGLVASTVASAEPAPVADESYAVEPAALWIDNEAQPDGFVLVRGDQVWVPAERMCAMRFCRDGGGDPVTRDGTRYVSLAGYGGDVTYRWDPDASECRVTIAPSAHATTVIQMHEDRPRDIELRPATSLFVNYALLGEVGIDEAASRSILGVVEGGLSVRGTLLHSTATISGAHVVRGLTSFTVDRRASLVSIVGGDAFVITGTLGGASVLGGLHVRRDLALDPYFSAEPSLSFAGGAETPSVVEIYRDGQLVRREIIPAGPYRVEDLTRNTGTDARVVVRDAFGMTKSVATTAAPPPSALRPGFSLFDASLGFVRRDLASASWKYGGLAALGMYRRGLTQRFTLGARAELAGGLASGGGSLLAYVGPLALEGQLATSVADPAELSGSIDASTAAAATLAWRRESISLTSAIRAVGRHYATIDLGPEDDRAVAAVDVAAAWAFSSRFTVGGQVAAEAWRDSPDRGRAAVTAGWQLGRLHLAGTMSIARDATGTISSEATMSLSIAHSRRTTSLHGVHAGAGGLRASSGVSHSMSGSTGTSYQATVSTGTDGATMGMGTVSAQSTYGRLDALAATSGAGGHVSLTASGGIVAIGGTVKATRAVRDGFALVRVPGVRGVRMYLENQPAGITDAQGNLVIPDLQAFYGNRVGIDVRDLPLAADMSALDRVIATPRRGGTIVTFSRQPSTALRGTLAGYRDGSLVDLSYGDLTVEDREAVPVGKDGAFEVENLTPGAHHATVLVEGRTCELELDSPGTAEVVDVGVVPCNFVGANQ